MTSTLRIGTRGSPLALWQANFVASSLSAHCATRLVEIQTTGDAVRDRPLPQIGGDGLFTKEIQDALLEGRVDVAVHSLKDLPTQPVAGLVLAAVPSRGAYADVFVSRLHPTLARLPPAAVVATSSLRRRAMVLHQRPDLRLVDIRGNVETRLGKLADPALAGLILARAGLERLGLEAAITEVLDLSWMLPAVGQGALGLECRADDARTRDLLRRLDDEDSRQAVLAERAFLRRLGGGCQVPIGALGQVRAGRLELDGCVLDSAGARRLAGRIEGPMAHAEALGEALAGQLLADGAAELLA